MQWLQRLKTVIRFLLFWLITSFAAFFLTDLVGLPILLILQASGANVTSDNKRLVLSGPYFWFQAFALIFFFFLVIFLWYRARYPYRIQYLNSQAENLQAHNPFDFKKDFRANLSEVLHSQLWLYAVLLAFPAFTCAVSWFLDTAPQNIIFNRASGTSLLDFGLTFFKPQHAFFDLLHPLGIFSVILGVALNLAVYWVVYSWILTMTHRRLYDRWLFEQDQREQRKYSFS